MANKQLPDFDGIYTGKKDTFNSCAFENLATDVSQMKIMRCYKIETRYCIWGS